MKNILFIVLVILTSCNKERSTMYNANLINNTSHSIVIRPYSSGQIVTENVIIIPTLTRKEIANGIDRGINGNSGFSSKYLDNSDSLRVTFDDIYTITHYNFSNPSSLNTRHYLNTSLRNLINYRSYLFDSKSLSKYQVENTYNFEFKEQDYLDAKP